MLSIGYEDIVSNIQSPTLVLAGPGAGKTYLLADRVKRLLDSGVSQHQITVLTFGKDASQHMRKQLLNPKGGFGVKYEKLPKISTMHSLALEIVKKKARGVGLRKADLQVQANENVKQLLYRDASFIIGSSEEKGKIARKCKAHGDCVFDTNEKKCEICKKYWEIMAKCNYIDFDDQILFACRILEKYPEILKEYQAEAHHLLVDEYQDINAAQLKLIKILCRNSRNGLFAVGDDAQSIYGFRGANPSFILNFREDFPNAFTPPLAHSRRCHENTINDVVKVLSKHYPDWTGPYDLKFHVDLGDKPVIWKLQSEKAEANIVARIARQATSEKKTILILVPKKDFFPLLSDSLIKYGVPHQRPVNTLSYQVNKRLEIIGCLLNWVKNPNDNFLTRLVLESIIDHGIAKVPGAEKGKKCKPETIENRVKAETEIAQLWESVDKKKNLLTTLNALESLSSTLQIIRESLGALRDSFEQSHEEYPGEFARRLIMTGGVWLDPLKLSNDFLSLVNLLDHSQPTGFGSVQLMTMRKAKGLEADIVVMVGLEDDIIPNPKSEVEEEARLFYVSMTRAIDKLYLLHSLRRRRNISFGSEITDKKRSRFLDALGRPSKSI